MLVASVIPAEPLPWAKTDDAARRRAAVKRKDFLVINSSWMMPDGWIVRPAGEY